MNGKLKPIGSFQNMLLALILVISMATFYGCNKNPGKFALGKEFIESQTNLTLIDTLSVNLSTVILDTVVTSGTGRLLIGNFQDNAFGKIKSSSYFQIGIPESFEVLDDEQYDSLRLAIRYCNYSFGDTTRIQKISVHQLTESIEFDEGSTFDGKSSFSYNPEPIGSIVFTPNPSNESDTLFIEISDDIGRDFFTLLRDDSEILTNNESFINYFHGLVLVADDAYEGSIIGFYASEANVELILHTSREDVSSEKMNYEFKLQDLTRQFNNIVHDFSSTQLYALVEQQNELPSSMTGGSVFLQGGIGLAIKVSFPSLPDLLLYDRGIIMKAQLSLAPLLNSYSEFALPSNLTIYNSDQVNRMLTDQGEIAWSSLTIDDIYQEETAYTFDITDYITYELSDSYVDPEKGLLITIPTTDVKSTFDRLILDAQNENTKLKIYYLSY
jgi:hypothetical protein